MRKTPKMLEIEEKIGEPLEVYLGREYADERMSAVKIGKKLRLCTTTILNWLREYNVEIRDISEATSIAQLPKGFVKPNKEKLEMMYVDERMSTWKIAERLGVSRWNVRNLLKEYKIETREPPGLSEGFVKPTREELKRTYADERMSAVKIGKKLGTSGRTVLNWLKEYEIPTRTNKYMSNPQFKDFLKNNQPALNLAGAALLMNGAG